MAAGQPALGVRHRPPAPLRLPRRRGRLRAGVAAPPGRGPLGGRDLARGLRRAGRRRLDPLRGAGGAGPGSGPRVGGPHRRQPGRSDAAGPRHRAPASPMAAVDPVGRHPLLPALQRARCRQRPGLGRHPGRAHRARRRRRVGGGRPEGVDLLRPVRRLGPVPGPHQHRGAQAGRDHRPGHRHAQPGRGGASAAPAHRRVRLQRGLPERRVRARRRGDRRGGRRLAGLVVDADPRTRHQPAPTGDPQPAPRGAAAPGRGAGRVRRRAHRASAWPRPSWR